MLDWCLMHPVLAFILSTIFLSIVLYFADRILTEKIKLECRVRELEEIICPHKSHDWVSISQTASMCRRCKKTRTAV